MYSATFGILRSDCTSTFIPFFSVFVATGNCGCCARTDTADGSRIQNASASKIPHQTLFMSHPYAENFQFVNPHARNTFCKTYKQTEMFALQMTCQTRRMFTTVKANNSHPPF